MPSTSGQVGLIYSRMSHFGEHSGWPAVVPYLQRRIECERLIAPRPITRLPHQILNHRLGPHDIPWYTLEALCWELVAARGLHSGRHSICHFLYGEGTYHYLARVRTRRGRPPGRVVCSFQQPPAVFDENIGRGTRLDLIDGVVVMGQRQADHLAAHVSEHRLFVVPHGVDTGFFQPRHPKRAAPATLLCVGSWLRDFSVLRDVALSAQHRQPDLRFTVVVNPRAAPELAGLPNVELRTAISDAELLDAYQSATAMILPLRDATANNALLEAMACGLPVVVTQVGGVSEYVSGRGALLVPPGQAEAMLDAALSILGSPARAADMGRHNRERALAFDWERTVDALLEVYANVLAA